MLITLYRTYQMDITRLLEKEVSCDGQFNQKLSNLTWSNLTFIRNENFVTRCECQWWAKTTVEYSTSAAHKTSIFITRLVKWDSCTQWYYHYSLFVLFRWGIFCSWSRGGTRFAETSTEFTWEQEQQPKCSVICNSQEKRNEGLWSCNSFTRWKNYWGFWWSLE